MPTPRDLLNEAKKSIREVDQADTQALLEGGGVTFLDVREPDEYEQGALPGAVHLPRGHLEFQVEGKLPDKGRPSSSTAPAACARPSRPRPWATWATPTSVPHRRLQQVEGRRPPLGGAPDPDAGPAQPLPAPPPAARGGRGGASSSCSAPRCSCWAPGAWVHRRLYLAAAGVGTLGHHRHGRGRRVQPAAPDPPQHGPGGRPQGRLGQEDADGAEPRRQRRRPTTCASAPTTSSTSLTATTSLSTGPTTSPPVTWSTTPRCSSGSP